MVNMESAHEAFMNVMSKIAQTQNELGTRIGRHSAAMEKIKQSGRNVFPRMRKEAQRAATSTNDAASEYVKNLPELAESVSFYFDGQLAAIDRMNLTNPEERTGLQNLREESGISAKAMLPTAKRRKAIARRSRVRGASLKTLIQLWIVWTRTSSKS